MKKGDIFKANDNFRQDGAIHPIIFWEMQDQATFKGLMITHSTGYGNIDLSEGSYFENSMTDFTTTNFVVALLLKPVDWLVNPNVLGKLSSTGIAYLEANGVDQLTPLSWQQYLKPKI